MSRRVRPKHPQRAEDSFLSRLQPTEPAKNDVAQGDLEQIDIPIDWQTVRVADVGKVVTGKTPSTKNPEFWNGDIPFITPVDLNDGIISRAERTISELGLSNVNELPQGSLAVSCIGYIGKAALINCLRSASNQQINSVIPSKEHDALFLLYRFISKRSQLEGAASITTVPILNKTNFENFLLKVPPLPEQKAIASVLRTVQQAKEASERVIAATRQLKQSLLQFLFTYGPVPFDLADKVPLKETEIGYIPANWPMCTLGELTEKPQYGLTASALETAVGPRFLRITDIQDGRVSWNTVPYCECSEEDFQKVAIRQGDILIARIGATTGKTFFVETAPEAVFASYLIRIRAKSGVEPNFIYRFTKTSTYWKQINAAKGGRLKQGVNIPVLRSLLIPNPPLSEQKAISEQLSALDKKLAAEEARRDALANLFQSLLHHLMTGRVRVTA